MKKRAPLCPSKPAPTRLFHNRALCSQLNARPRRSLARARRPSAPRLRPRLWSPTPPRVDGALDPPRSRPNVANVGRGEQEQAPHRGVRKQRGDAERQRRDHARVEGQTSLTSKLGRSSRGCGPLSVAASALGFIAPVRLMPSELAQRPLYSWFSRSAQTRKVCSRNGPRCCRISEALTASSAAGKRQPDFPAEFREIRGHLRLERLPAPAAARARTPPARRSSTDDLDVIVHALIHLSHVQSSRAETGGDAEIAHSRANACSATPAWGRPRMAGKYPR